jgi:hypothetical protein
MTAAQYFWLVDHNDWSRWFAISSPPRICSSSFCFIGGIVKRKRANLRHLILLSRVTYWAPLEMLLVFDAKNSIFQGKMVFYSFINCQLHLFFFFPLISLNPFHTRPMGACVVDRNINIKPHVRLPIPLYSDLSELNFKVLMKKYFS